VQFRTEELQAQRNNLSKQVGQLKSKGEPADAVMAQVVAIKDELDSTATLLESLQVQLHGLLLGVPNLPQDDVPVGGGESDNQELPPLVPPQTA